MRSRSCSVQVVSEEGVVVSVMPSICGAVGCQTSAEALTIVFIKFMVRSHDNGICSVDVVKVGRLVEYSTSLTMAKVSICEGSKGWRQH